MFNLCKDFLCVRNCVYVYYCAVKYTGENVYECVCVRCSFDRVGWFIAVTLTY
jgi:hypothetical protein